MIILNLDTITYEIKINKKKKLCKKHVKNPSFHNLKQLKLMITIR